MADELTHLLVGALHTEANAVSAWNDPEARTLTARRAIGRKRTLRSLAVGGAGLVAAAGVSAVLMVSLDFNNDPVSPASPTASPTASAPAVTQSPTPSATATAEIKDWDAVADANKPAFVVGQNPVEPQARTMEDWVWDYVDDTWQPWVFTDRATGEYAIASQALFLTAPNGDLFRLFDLSTESDIVVEHWDASDRLAWIAKCPGGDTCWVIQADLMSGTIDPNWGDGAIPQRAVSPWGVEGVANAAFVAALPSGDELWTIATYFQTYDGFFLRSADGVFRSLAGEDVIDSSIASGSVNRMGDPGIEAWVTADYSYAIVLLQWMIPFDPTDPGDNVFHTSKAQWVVINLADNTAEVSDTFVPSPPLCQATSALVPTASSALPATVTADCGGVRYALVPLTGQAAVVSN